MPLLHELTVSQAAQDIKDKKLSPVVLVQSLLDRIEATDESLKVVSYTHLTLPTKA